MKKLAPSLLLALTLAACAVPGGVTTPALTPSRLPSPAPSDSPSPSPSPSASPSPTPSPSATPAPSGGGRSSAPSFHPELYVMNGLGQTISAIDPDTHEVRLQFGQTGQVPNQLVRDGSQAYVVSSGDAVLQRLDLASGAIQSAVTFPTGSNPLAYFRFAASDPLGFVTFCFSALTDTTGPGGSDRPEVGFIDPTGATPPVYVTVPRGIPAGEAAKVGDFIYVPVGDLYTLSPSYSILEPYSAIQVFQVSTQSWVKEITWSDPATDALNPYSIAVTPDGTVMVSTNQGVYKLDLGDPSDPADDAIDPAAPLTFGLTTPFDWSNPAPHSLRVVSDTEAYAAVGQGLVAFDPSAWTAGTTVTPAGGDTSVGHFEIEDGVAYVPNFADDTLTLVKLADGSILRTYAVGDGPQEVAFR